MGHATTHFSIMQSPWVQSLSSGALRLDVQAGSLSSGPLIPHVVCRYVIPHAEAICHADEKTGHVSMKLPPPANVFACSGDKMAAGTVWLGLGGLALTAVLMSRSFKGSIIIGIIFVTVIAWILGHDASFFGHSSPIPGQPPLFPAHSLPQQL